MRELYGTDWVFTAFVVRAVNDPDHMFANTSRISYSYAGGPFLAVPYPAGYPGDIWFTQAFILQITRIFWAREEMLTTNPELECEIASGYLNYYNKNKTLAISPWGKQSCIPGQQPVPCIANSGDVMYGYDGPPCRYTEGMLGYIDRKPVDGIPDAFAAGPEIDFGTAAIETLTAQQTSVRFKVTAAAVPNKNSRQTRPGLRRDYAAPLMDVNYLIGGIGPISTGPEDGVFDELEEDFNPGIPFLIPGYSDFEVAARNVFGAKSEASKQIFYIGLDYYGFRFEYRNNGIGLGWSTRGETFDAEFDLHRLDHYNGDADTVIVENIQPVGPVNQGGLTPYYNFDAHVSPGAEYSYYVRGSFDMFYRGQVTTFTTNSDTFRTVASFPRAGSILSAPSPNPFSPAEHGNVWISVSVNDLIGNIAPQGVSGGPQLATDDEFTPVEVTIKVYDVLGRLVKDLYQDRVYVTVVTESWDGTNQAGNPAPSGMYFIKAKAGEWTGTKKLLVIR
jgi:hypothetical protein